MATTTKKKKPAAKATPVASVGNVATASPSISGPAVEKLLEELDQYQVKTKGFTEQYSSYTVAKRNFDGIKRKKMKAEEPFKVTLSAKSGGGSWVELDFCEVKEEYYQE